MKTILIITLLLCCSFSAYADLQQDVINSDAISFDNVPSGVDGSVQYKLGSGFGSDTNFFFDTTNISLGLGTNSPTLGGVLPGMKLLVEQENEAATIGAITHTDTQGVGSNFFVARSRGTKSSPSVVQDGDRLAAFLGYGYGSTFYGLAAEINIEVSGTPSGNTIPSRMNFRLQTGSGLVMPMSLINNRVQFFDTGTKPTCDSSTRFSYWYDEGGAGIKDTVEVCAKDAGDTYGWRTVY
ncbi:MAG: hypothetical protein DHS20C13_02760 [Thermodesulfobacteriota bacterium]|nr:MAG: hypothetical protein DHS20C13_02760 [Thermodesulfobacteriota bacterium]